MNERHKLEDLSRQRVEDYLRRASITYLECCVGLMLTHLSHQKVAEILEQEARLLREFG